MKQTLYRRVAYSLIEDIEQGRYAPNSKVPSIRELSDRKNVSISTITKAYAMLEDQGFIRSRPQSGYFVQKLPGQKSPPMSRGDQPRRVTKLDLITSLLQRGAEEQFINLGSAIPDLSFQPLASLQKYAQKALRYERDKAFAFNIAPGSLSLRQIIAQRLLANSVRSHVDDILLTTGATEALSLCLRACTSPGDIVAIESPCYYGFLQIANTLNLRVIEIPTDVNTGISVEALKLAIQQWDIKTILLSTRFSNPTGALIPDANKIRLYELAVQQSIPIIEDDVYGDLSHQRQNPSVIKSLDRQGLVLYCSSFSKTLSPGLRLGWCLPGRFYERVRQFQLASTWSVSGLSQLSTEAYLTHGHFDKHLRKLKNIMEENVYKARQLLQSQLNLEVAMSKPQGSFLFWLSLPKNIDVHNVHKCALELGVNLAPGSVFSNTNQFDNCLRINCALPWHDKLEPGMKKLIRCIESSRC